MGLDGSMEEEDDPLWGPDRPWGPKQGDGDDNTSLINISIKNLDDYISK